MDGWVVDERGWWRMRGREEKERERERGGGEGRKFSLGVHDDSAT